MKKLRVDKLPFRQMRHELYYAYHKNVLSIVDRLSPEALLVIGISAMLVPYRKCFEILKAALDIVFKSKYSDDFIEADRERDRIFMGFKSAVRTMLYHFNTAYHAPAKRLMDLFKHYGNVTKKSYNEESAAIEDFLRELEDREDLQDDMKTLQLLDWRDRLEAYNTRFYDLTIQRYEERAAMPASRMKDVRKETDQYFRVIVAHLDALLTLNNTAPELLNFVAELNAITKDYKEVIGRQRTNKPEEPKEEKKEEVTEVAEPVVEVIDEAIQQEQG